MTDIVNYAFLHGGGQGSWVWNEAIAALHQQCQGKLGRVLALDVPGCGEKRGPDTEKLGHDAWPNSTYAATEWRYDHLSAIPSTYVVCLKDGIVPIEWQEKLAARYKVQRLVRIDAGHQAMNTRPHSLAEILRFEAEV